MSARIFRFGGTEADAYVPVALPDQPEPMSDGDREFFLTEPPVEPLHPYDVERGWRWWPLACVLAMALGAFYPHIWDWIKS